MALRFIAFLIIINYIGLQAQTKRELDPGAVILEEQQKARTLDKIQKQTKSADLGSAYINLHPLPKEQLCFPIKTIRFQGHSSLKKDILNRIIQTYSQSCIGGQGINQILNLIRQAYLAEALVTSQATLPAQDLKSGILIIDLSEGKIDHIYHYQITKNKAQRSPHRKVQTAFPFQEGKTLNLRSLEQGLDQINRLSSQKAKLDIAPSNEKIAYSNILIQNPSTDFFRAYLGFDQQGSYTTGENRLRLSTEWDDALKLNDALSLGLVNSLNSNAVFGDWSLPWGFWTWGISGSYSETLLPLTTLSEMFTQSSNLSLRGERLLFRDATSKTKTKISYSLIDQSRAINAVDLTPMQEAKLTLGLSREKQIDKGFWFLEALATQGTPALFGDDDIPNLPKISPAHEFSKLEINFTYIKYFGEWRLQSAQQMQLSNKALFSHNQFNLGGLGSVRGFKGQEQNGDRGWASQNDISFPKFKLLNKIHEGLSDDLNFYAFTDLGITHDIANSQSHRMLGLGLGVRFNLSKGLTGDFYSAYPIYADQGWNIQKPEIGFSINKKIF